jgi:hypothetical protein
VKEMLESLGKVDVKGFPKDQITYLNCPSNGISVCIGKYGLDCIFLYVQPSKVFKAY